MSANPIPEMKSEVEQENQIDGIRVLDNLNKQLREAHGWKWGSRYLALIMGFSSIGVNYAARNYPIANPDVAITLALESTIFFAIAAGATVAAGIFQWREKQIQGKIDVESQSDLDVVDAIQTIEKVQD